MLKLLKTIEGKKGGADGALVLSVTGFNSRSPLEYSVDGGANFTVGRGHADAYVIDGLTSGEYEVVVRSLTGDCTTNLGMYTIDCTNSIALPFGAEPLDVYPNPVTQVLRADAQPGKAFVVTNSLGQKVMSGDWLGELNVHRLPTGTYILRIGRRVARFIRQ